MRGMLTGPNVSWPNISSMPPDSGSKIVLTKQMSYGTPWEKPGEFVNLTSCRLWNHNRVVWHCSIGHLFWMSQGYSDEPRAMEEWKPSTLKWSNRTAQISISLGENGHTMIGHCPLELHLVFKHLPKIWRILSMYMDIPYVLLLSCIIMLESKESLLCSKQLASDNGQNICSFMKTKKTKKRKTTEQ